jgi:hypothetical protein
MQQDPLLQDSAQVVEAVVVMQLVEMVLLDMSVSPTGVLTNGYRRII